MGAKKRQTMGKIIRERERAEKRARKQEKKDEKKATAVAAAELGISVEEFAARQGAPVPSEQSEEIASPQ